MCYLKQTIRYLFVNFKMGNVETATEKCFRSDNVLY